jgi:FlaG/FlaF family flagellin (archaellin)
MSIRDDRSVSDVLAFVLVFSIIITSVGLVYSVGFSSLSDFQESEQKTNAARAFDAFSSVFDDVQEGRAVARNGELRLSGGTIQVSEESEFDIRVENSSGGTLWSGTNTTGSLLYTVDGTTIGYENGGAFRRDGDASAMINEPSFLCQGDRAVVSLVVLRADDVTAQSGDGNVQIKARANRSMVLYSAQRSSSNAESVNLSFTDSEFGDAWDRYLVDNGWTYDSSNDEYGCSADSVVIRVTVIDVEIPAPR